MRAFFSLLGLACASACTPPADTSDPETGETGDTASPEYFPAVGFDFRYYLGVKGGQLADWTEDGDAYYSQLVWTFVDEEYLSLIAKEGADLDQIEEEHTCKAWFALESSSAERTTGAWYDWDLQLDLRTSRCLLDPAVFEGGVVGAVADDAMGIGILPADPAYVTELGSNWEEDAPYLLGLDTWVNGQSLDQGSFEHESLVFGWALDADGAVDRQRPLTPADMAAAPDAYLWSFSLFVWTY